MLAGASINWPARGESRWYRFLKGPSSSTLLVTIVAIICGRVAGEEVTCGTELPGGPLAGPQSHKTCSTVLDEGYTFPWYVPMKVHVVRHSDGTVGTCQGGSNDGNACSTDSDCPADATGSGYCSSLPDDQLTLALAAFNDTLSGSGLPIRVFQVGAVDYINNDFWTDPSGQVCDGGSSDLGTCNTDADCPGGTCRNKAQVLKGQNVLANALNIYFVPDYNLGGSGSFTTHVYQGIVVRDDSAASGKTTSHELGHYFDLLHTHEGGDECPDGSNCDHAGDNICDTPADPNLNGNVTVNTCSGGTSAGAACAIDSDCPGGTCALSCVYSGSASPPSACDGTPYAPDPSNLMSYAPSACRDRFTTDQINCALSAWLDHTNRLELFERTRYVDSAAASGGDGTPVEPIDSVEDGVSSATGKFVFIKSGTYNEFSPSSPLVLSKQMHLRRWDEGAGSVVIK